MEYVHKAIENILYGAEFSLGFIVMWKLVEFALTKIH